MVSPLALIKLPMEPVFCGTCGQGAGRGPSRDVEQPRVAVGRLGRQLEVGCGGVRMCVIHWPLRTIVRPRFLKNISQLLNNIYF